MQVKILLRWGNLGNKYFIPELPEKSAQEKGVFCSCSTICSRHCTLNLGGGWGAVGGFFLPNVVLNHEFGKGCIFPPTKVKASVVEY